MRHKMMNGNMTDEVLRFVDGNIRIGIIIPEWTYEIRGNIEYIRILEIIDGPKITRIR